MSDILHQWVSDPWTAFNQWIGQSALGGSGLLVAIVLVVLLRVVLTPMERKRARLSAAFLLLHLLFLFLMTHARGDSSASSFYASLALFFLLACIVEASFLLVVHALVQRLRHSPPKIFLDILLGAFYFGIVVYVLHDAGVQLSSLLTGSALVTAILGLSLKDTFGNIFAGLAIHAQHPFEIGDWIQFDDRQDHIGKVLEINWRATKVITLDVVEVIVPNAKLADFPIRNFTKPERWSRRSLYVVCPYDVPPGKVHKIILEAIADSWGVNRHPAPSVVTNAFTDRGIEYWIRFFTAEFDSRDRVDGGARDRIWYALSRYGVSLPYAQRQVELRQVTEETLALERIAQIHQVKENLRKVDIFNALPEQSLDRLAMLAKVHFHVANEVILRQGDEGSELYIIRDGIVTVSKERGGQREMEVGRIGPGKFFGEMALLTGQRRTATIRAAEDCELLVVDKPAMSTVLTENPELAARIAEVLARRTEGPDAQSIGEDDKASTNVETTLLSRIKSFFSL
ncbi:MAG: mechanosensitive ion channel family protein [Planctomycetota bacterium]